MACGNFIAVFKYDGRIRFEFLVVEVGSVRRSEIDYDEVVLVFSYAEMLPADAGVVANLEIYMVFPAENGHFVFGKFEILKYSLVHVAYVRHVTKFRSLNLSYEPQL